MKISARGWLVFGACAAIAAAKRQPELIAIADENKREGARDWQLTRVRLDERGGYRASDIEGYVSHQSIAAGETLDLFVSTRDDWRERLDAVGVPSAPVLW